MTVQRTCRLKRKGDLHAQPESQVSGGPVLSPHLVPRAWRDRCQSSFACAPMCTYAQRGAGALLPGCRPSECCAAPSLNDGSRPVHLGQRLSVQGQTSEAGVYPDLHLYVWGMSAVGAGASLPLQLEPRSGRSIPTSCHLYCQATRCGSVEGQRQDSLRTALVPDPESPVRNKADRLHLKK